jgi:hypothetical protein
MEHLTAIQFRKRFSEEWDRIEADFYKLETLQHYHEPDNPAYRALREGALEEAITMLPSLMGGLLKVGADGRHRFSYERARVVSFPLTPYTVLELHSYVIGQRAGHKIYMIEQEVLGELNPILRPYVSDFVMFDGRTALAHEYDKAGTLQGAVLLATPRELAPLIECRRALVSLWEPFDQFLARRGVHLKLELLE